MSTLKESLKENVFKIGCWISCNNWMEHRQTHKFEWNILKQQMINYRENNLFALNNYGRWSSLKKIVKASFSNGSFHFSDALNFVVEVKKTNKYFWNRKYYQSEKNQVWFYVRFRGLMVKKLLY